MNQREREGGREREEKTSSSPPPFLLLPSHLPYGLLFLLSPIFLCQKIKDGGYNNTNMYKVSPTQNTLQAIYDWINITGITGYNKQSPFGSNTREYAKHNV